MDDFQDSTSGGGCTAYSMDVVSYAIGTEETGPVELIHPTSGQFPTLTYRYANGILHHLVRK